MFQQRYNRIAQPLFFIIDLLLLLSIYKVFFPINYYVDLLVIFTIWTIPSIKFLSYKVKRTFSTINAIKPMVSALNFFCIFYLIFLSLNIFSSRNFNNHIFFLGSIYILLTLICLFRFFLLHQYRIKGKNYLNIVIICPEIDNYELNKIKNDCAHYGYNIISIVRKSDNYKQKLIDIISNEKINIVFLINLEEESMDKLTAYCDEKAIRTKILIPYSSFGENISNFDYLGNHIIIDIRHEPLLYLGNRIVKRIFDLTLSILSIVLVLSWLPILVKIFQYFSYPGSLFFIQERIGKDGKVFKLYKFRTMYESSETLKATKGHSKITSQSDIRISIFGNFLRRTNLDEYPQFINVFFGTMSAIGPRPHMIGEDQILEKNIPRYRVRRFVKPGITGWAAINGFRGGTNNFKLMGKRTELDIWYLENWSIWLDIKIIFITIKQMLTLKIPKAY